MHEHRRTKCPASKERREIAQCEAGGTSSTMDSEEKLFEKRNREGRASGNGQRNVQEDQADRAREETSRDERQSKRTRSPETHSEGETFSLVAASEDVEASRSPASGQHLSTLMSKNDGKDHTLGSFGSELKEMIRVCAGRLGSLFSQLLESFDTISFESATQPTHHCVG